MLIATKYYGIVGAGVTLPHLFRANNKKFYVVKLQNNPLGPKVLVNELLASKFGKLMDLCFPPGDIIQITEEILQQNPRLMTAEAQAGLHFASQFIHHTEYMEKHHLAKAVNKTQLAGVILFDHLFHNADRTSNYKNLLIKQQEEGYKIVAIDNSHLFIYGKWTEKLLQRLGTKIKIYYHYSYGWLLRYYLSSENFFPYLEIVSKISNEQIEQLVQEIPHQWLPDEQERQALVSYIKLRCNMLEELWEKLSKHIPRDHRQLIAINNQESDRGKITI